MSLLKHFNKDDVLFSTATFFLVIAILFNPFDNLPPAPDFVGSAIHPLYPAFSSPEPGVIISNSLLSASDDAVYKIGYYSVNGGAWHSFTLSGTVLGGNWFNGTATYSLPDFGNGEHYVVVYTCNHDIGSWDCYGNKWQLIIINNTVRICSGSNTQSCNITNGIGNRTMTCTNGVWGAPYGTCNIQTCNTGYTKSGNTCVANTTSCIGSNIIVYRTCNIPNGAGNQTMTCNTTTGTWGTPYGTCNIQTCNSGYTKNGNTCVANSNCMTLDQVAAYTAGCLYIYQNNVYRYGSYGSKHYSHACGSDVTSSMPSSHKNNANKYLTPYILSPLC